MSTTSSGSCGRFMAAADLLLGPSSVFRDTLGALVDPNFYNGPLDLAQISDDWALTKLRDMVGIRVVEEVIANLVEGGEARCPCHLGIGQEAVAVGVSEHARPTDRVFGAHRSHSHYLALGGSVERLLAEVLGKETGTSKGMGGSMHLYGPEVGFHGSVPIVAATIPIATGAALAAQMDKKGAVAISYFGDGAAEEGVLHELLNMAAVMGLPIVFVCENNLFSSHLDIHLRQPENRVARFADAHDVPSAVVDGNDVVILSRKMTNPPASSPTSSPVVRLPPVNREGFRFQALLACHSRATLDRGSLRRRWTFLCPWISRSDTKSFIKATRFSKLIFRIQPSIVRRR